MYHYQKNIGDYRSATMHLSLLEHGVYNQLLDWYYLDEQPLPTDNRTLFRRLSAKTETEQEAVVAVLAEMFVQTDAGWVHKRVEREIAQYKVKAEQARQAGKLGGRPPKKGIGSSENRDGFQKEPDAKPTANREPLTTNQKPEGERSPNGSRLPADWVMTDDMEQFCQTERPDLIPSEVACRFADYWHGVAGAKGRKADWPATWRNWVRGEKAQPQTFAQKAADVIRTTVPAKPGRDPTLQRLEEDAARAAPVPLEVRQKLASMRRPQVEQGA